MSKKLLQHYNPHHFMERYTVHFYKNAEYDMIRNYAVIYDKDNIDKYPVSTQFHTFTNRLRKIFQFIFVRST